MIIPDKFVYLIALMPFCLIWIFLFIKRRDLRREMILTSILIGTLSVLTSYFWWTKDWWKPQTITGTIVGIEDFVMGFAAGGIMSIIYDFFLNKGYSKFKAKQRLLSSILLMAFMALLMFYLFLIVGLTSFLSSVITMALVILFLNYFRKDLMLNSLISGVFMLFISITFYFVILLISNTWVSNTYLHGLSGISLATIPIEEFIFWFLAGMWVGPFYEYTYGKKLKSIKVKG